MIPTLAAVARDVEQTIESTGVPSGVIGGLALQRWGRPRVTLDVDVVAYTGFDRHEGRVIDALFARFTPRRPDARTMAEQHRVCLLRSTEGVGIDVSLGGLDFEKELVDRATPFDFGDGLLVRTCSAEDLVVLKAFADRPWDWSDLEGVLQRQGNALDWRAIVERLAPLVELKEAPHILSKLKELRTRIQTRRP